MRAILLWLLIATPPPPPEPDPELVELARFPSLAACQEAMAFNRRYRDHADACRHLYPHTGTAHGQHPERDNLDAAIAETDYLYYVWDCLVWAHDPDRAPASRRYWLGRLREEIGPAAFAHGAMPVCVPLRFFRCVD